MTWLRSSGKQPLRKLTRSQVIHSICRAKHLILYKAYDDLKQKAGQVMPTFFGWVKEQDKHGQNWEKAQQEVPLFAKLAKAAMQDGEFM